MKSKLMKKMTMSYKENPLHTECKGDSQYITTIAFLHDTLCHHSFCHLHESGNVSTFHVVHITISFSTILYAGFVNVLHDALQFLVYLFRTPAQFDRVLSHFKTGY